MNEQEMSGHYIEPEPPNAALERAVSVVVPAYNEQGGIEATVAAIQAVMDPSDWSYELLVVDDGSEDETAELAARAGATVLKMPENRGYGAALKAGIRRASHEAIVIIDADGTYPAEAIPRLLERLSDYDMVVGARQGLHARRPRSKAVAKWFLRRLASYLAGREIPDLNSGLRAIRKTLVLRFEHLLPSGFSFTTTITLASLSSGQLVTYEPIDYHERIGSSKIRPGHALDFLLLILRTVVYFNPLKVFLPVGAVFFLAGLTKLIYDIYVGNLSETTVLAFIGASLLWGVGLISDQISKVALRWGAA